MAEYTDENPYLPPNQLDGTDDPVKRVSGPRKYSPIYSGSSESITEKFFISNREEDPWSIAEKVPYQPLSLQNKSEKWMHLDFRYHNGIVPPASSFLSDRAFVGTYNSRPFLAGKKIYVKEIKRDTPITYVWPGDEMVWSVDVWNRNLQNTFCRFLFCKIHPITFTITLGDDGKLSGTMTPIIHELQPLQSAVLNLYGSSGWYPNDHPNTSIARANIETIQPELIWETRTDVTPIRRYLKMYTPLVPREPQYQTGIFYQGEVFNHWIKSRTFHNIRPCLATGGISPSTGDSVTETVANQEIKCYMQLFVYLLDKKPTTNLVGYSVHDATPWTEYLTTGVYYIWTN